MFPDAYDAPTVFPESLVDGAVSPMIAGDFFIPEATVCNRALKALRAAMPEAAIHKHGEFVLGKNEIRLAENSLMTAPAGDAVFPENTDQCDFRILIARTTDAVHYLRSFLF